jgi:predicted ATP-dependent protease
LTHKDNPAHRSRESRLDIGRTAMAAKSLSADAVGLPRFEVPAAPESAGAFDLSSHTRAREALDFGISTRDPGFNVFVVGGDRSGRMTATLGYLNAATAAFARPPDWVYLNNFRHPNEPVAVRLPPGTGRAFRDAMQILMPQLRAALKAAFEREEYQVRIREESERVRAAVNVAIEAVGREAETAGLTIVQAAQGLMVVALGANGEPVDFSKVADDRRPALEAEAARVSERLAEINRQAARGQAALAETIGTLNRDVAETAVTGLLDALFEQYGTHRGLNRWLVEFRVDLIDNLNLFRPRPEGVPPDAVERPEDRYAVNLFVDNGEVNRPAVVLEANPTYENLFGQIEYRQVSGVLQTDFSMVRSGALHRANGGVLVLRAEALAALPHSWNQLKGALRDGCIRLEEMHRAGGVPIAGAPSPQPIPLDVRVVIVGAPQWYYAFFSIDPEFQAWFKIKAEIDAEMDASASNLATYGALIQGFAARHRGARCADDAVAYLTGLASRWADDRTKLTAQFERIEDIVSEAAHHAAGRSGKKVGTLSRDDMIHARRQRRWRNARVEDRVQESIRRGAVMIATQGAVVGQINALTVRDLGDHAFGAPSRVTARTHIGRRGVTNIEREAALGGPIQQKGAMVLQGFLAGLFARRLPLSFNASITFEQSYGGVEGDSATLAEALAVLSDLADLPLRQDLAVTGSANQRGEVQAIGGLVQKAEGFYRTCVEAGELTGTQGVVFPAANEANLILRSDIVDAVAAGRFHFWSVRHIDEAIELFTGVPAGVPDAAGDYPPDTVYGRIAERLIAFDNALDLRGRKRD